MGGKPARTVQKVLSPLPAMLSGVTQSRQRSAPFVRDTENVSPEPLGPNSVEGHRPNLKHYLSKFIGFEVRKMPLFNLSPHVMYTFSARIS